MKYLSGSIITFSVLVLCKGQYYQDGAVRDDGQYYSRTPPPQILSHKQALNHDGNFKYAFAAENGLAQGESIAPDGTRTGGYTYVDPTGKKISVKYTAGKDGFRILEGDHVPKPPPHALIAEQTARRQEPVQYRPAPAQYVPPAPPVPHYQPHGQPRAAYTQPRPVYSQANALAQRDLDYHDEPGKPHTFGTGYVFEFSG